MTQFDCSLTTDISIFEVLSKAMRKRTRQMRHCVKTVKSHLYYQMNHSWLGKPSLIVTL